MLIFKAKKYAFAGLCCAFFSLLLMALSGCNPTSDPREFYEPTGSWEGTIGADRVRGIVAPDGSFHLAVVDAAGALIPDAGEYVGTVSLTDRENNLGKLSVVFLRPPASAEILHTGLSFALSRTTLYSKDAPFLLNRTSDANGPAAQADVAGRWSLSVTDNDELADITNLIVDAGGNLSGNDGDACQYSGTLKLIDPAWNIFQLGLTFSDYLDKDCQEDTARTYGGLAMTLPPENNRQHLWVASTVWTFGGTRTDTLIENLAATINVAPVARMSANAIELQSNVVQAIKVKKVSGKIKLDAQGSSDGNHDALTYRWSGTDPNGAALVNILATPEGIATFTPAMEGKFTLRLTVNDGFLDSTEIIREIQVQWVADRFVDCTNGTVLDTTTNLFWLKDAGCPDLHSASNWWVNLATATANVNTLASGDCGLTDGSGATNWRLPLPEEFATIIEKNNSYASPPALVNGVGDQQWSEGDVFSNVGTHPFAGYKVWIYWTSAPTFVESWIQYGYFIDFGGAQGEPDRWSGYTPTANINAVWPVRDELSAVPGDEVNACLQAAAQQ